MAVVPGIDMEAVSHRVASALGVSSAGGSSTTVDIFTRDDGVLCVSIWGRVYATTDVSRSNITAYAVDLVLAGVSDRLAVSVACVSPGHVASTSGLVDALYQWRVMAGSDVVAHDVQVVPWWMAIVGVDRQVVRPAETLPSDFEPHYVYRRGFQRFGLSFDRAGAQRWLERVQERLFVACFGDAYAPHMSEVDGSDDVQHLESVLETSYGVMSADELGLQLLYDAVSVYPVAEEIIHTYRVRAMAGEFLFRYLVSMHFVRRTPEQLSHALSGMYTHSNVQAWVSSTELGAVLPFREGKCASAKAFYVLLSLLRHDQASSLVDVLVDGI